MIIKVPRLVIHLSGAVVRIARDLAHRCTRAGPLMVVVVTPVTIRAASFVAKGRGATPVMFVGMLAVIVGTCIARSLGIAISLFPFLYISPRPSGRVRESDCLIRSPELLPFPPVPSA